jgi:tetratricopeptide (TPR) repeat protein
MKKIYLTFLFTLSIKVIWSQTDLLMLSRASECVDTNYTPSLNDKANHAIIAQILQNSQSTVLINHIRVRECQGLNNCVTKKVANNSNLVFILYDNAFINDRKKSVPKSDDNRLSIKGDETKDWVTIGILAHELGHLLCKHIDDSLQNNPHQRELEADEWIGIALRKMGASLQEAQQCMQGSSVNSKGSHPGRAPRLAAIERGYYRLDLRKAIDAFHANDFFLAYKLLIHKDLELDAVGYWCLGQLQEYGRGGAVKDTFDATESYLKAILKDSNYCAAYEGLARLYKTDKNMVKKWQTKAALRDCPKALTYMGYYMEGEGDYISAAKLYQKATRHDDPKAWHNLACLYQAGRGVVRSEQNALGCYQKAAKLGHARSIAYLKEKGLPLK